MDIATIDKEAAELVFPAFDEDTAWALGSMLVTMARERGHPVVIDIRTPNRTLFHVALPGATPGNDLWARRKSNVALQFGRASMAVTLRERDKGRTVEAHGLTSSDYAFSGGAVPERRSRSHCHLPEASRASVRESQSSPRKARR